MGLSAGGVHEVVVNAVVHRDYTDPGNMQIRIFDDRLKKGTLPKSSCIELHR
jgi:hypothetical protein